jgi:hypothetical protein
MTRAHNEARRTRICSGTSSYSPTDERTKDNAKDVAKADESDIPPWFRSIAAHTLCDAAGLRRSHGYLPPKKFPVGGKAAIGLTRPRRNSLAGYSAAVANQCTWPVEPTRNRAGQSTHAYSSLRIGTCQGLSRPQRYKLRQILAAACREAEIFRFPRRKSRVRPRSRRHLDRAPRGGRVRQGSGFPDATPLLADPRVIFAILCRTGKLCTKSHAGATDTNR